MSRSGVSKLALVAVLLLFSACAQESDENPLVVGGSGPEGPLNTGDDENQPQTPDNLRDVVDGAIADVESFWTETYPQLYGSEFEPVEGYYGYGPDTEMPPCGNPRPSYEEIADNAFYCPESDIIAADEDRLIPFLAENFHPFTIGIVFAHEYGHAIQARAGAFADRSVVTEMQADCFAGAWTAWVADGNSDNFEVSEDQLDFSVAGMITISDVPGTSPDDLAAHGSGFDRIGSFQDGFDKGAARCAEYDSDPNLPIVEIEFTLDDAQTGGNLPSADLLPLLEDNLDLFYETLFSQRLEDDWQSIDQVAVVDPDTDEIQCGGETLSDSDLEYASYFCADENIVVIDGTNLVPLLEEIGDFAVAAEVARLYAVDAQLQLGVEDRNKTASLQADCLTGVWASASFPDENGDTQLGEAGGLTLSAGDLDEGIQGFVTYGGDRTDETGTVFERVQALRAGFLDGVEACDLGN
jgi:predicted metalloprotease